MKRIGIAIAVVASVVFIGAWVVDRPGSSPVTSIPTKAVGTRPVGVSREKALTAFMPTPEDSIIGFSAGCFWGTEEAFRKMPGIVATAVGYTGGTVAFPTYEQAHRTGHLETVLVEFNPKRTPLAALLKTFWSLRPSTAYEIPGAKASSHRPAIWTYDEAELQQAIESLKQLEAKTGRKLTVRILPAQPFYLAEEYHQQYDEKSGTEACPISR